MIQDGGPWWDRCSASKTLSDRVLKLWRRVFRLPPFSAYLLAVAAWFFPFGLQTTIFPGVINYTLQEPADRLGLAQAALTAPMLFLLPLTGVLAERFDRRFVMSGFHILAATAAGMLAILLFSDQLSYWVMVAFALIVGVCSAFVLPARDSAVNPVTEVVQRLGKKDLTLQKAVILTSMVQFAAQICGMGAGFLAGQFGPGALFATQGIVLLIGAGAALTMPRLHSRHVDHPPILQSLGEGIRTVMSSNVLLPMTLIMVGVGFFVVGGGFFVIIPVLVRDGYDGGYGLLALLMIAFWIGAFVANLILARAGAIEHPGRVLMVAQFVTVGAIGLLALPIPLLYLFGLVFLWGLGGGVAISLSRSVIQEQAPAKQLARVMSVYQLGLFGGMPAGAFAMGLVVANIGPRPAAIIPMIGLLVVLIAICVFTPILKVRRVDPG